MTTVSLFSFLFLCPMEPRQPSVSCNEKKNWEILPFMCDDDESGSLAASAYAEKTGKKKKKSFVGIKRLRKVWGP